MCVFVDIAPKKKTPMFLFCFQEEIFDRFNDIIHKQIEPKLDLLFKNRPDLPVE